MEKLPPLRKMSWKTPQNVEEMKWQWGNILVLGAKHGETTTAEENVPESVTNQGGNCVAVKKHPGFAGKTWRNYHR